MSAHSWTLDLIDNTLTLAVDNTNPLYSYVYFYGSGGSPAGTAPILSITIAGCGGSFTTFGTGGKDSTGAVVKAMFSGCPTLGSTIKLGAQYGANALMSVTVGLSDKTWTSLGLALPYDMALMGAPGNHIYSDPLVILARQAMGTIQATIPMDPTLKGFTFFSQTVVFDRNANSTGLVTGPGVRVKISN